MINIIFVYDMEEVKARRRANLLRSMQDAAIKEIRTLEDRILFGTLHDC